jgi:5-methyltetrahydrofolate--homocysteine methyltransferase
MVELSGVRVIGERINPTGKKRFQQALREHDLNYIMERAIEQAEAGADILDINVGLPGLDEPSLMRQVVQAVQSVVDLPLQIDSSDPAAIEAGLRACHGRAIVNSVNAEPEVLQRILPLVKRYGAAVVGLTMDKSGIPQTAEARLALGRRILDSAQSYGIPKEDVLLDCLTLTVSAQQEQARETLRAVRMVHEELGLHCVLGVSNISFGLPERSQITVSFLTQAMACGLDLPIVNPNQREIMDAIAAYKALSGEDRDCAAYIERFAQRPKTEPAAQTTTQLTLSAAVLKGLKQETAELTGKLLEEMGELEVINQHLIPALDVVGEQYERQEIFLPQLINAANAACAGFDLIKARIAARGGESVSKGKIVLATVEGDIHDIGKNIVRVVLENYGYQVIDLGRDVPVERVVEVAVAEQVQLVGLSALMTTTVESMRRTIEALRQSGHPCKVMVGGAVLTPEYAAEIGADFYAKDAKQSADIAKQILG